MLVSKNKGTDSLLQSEKKSLFRFLALYIAMVTVVIILLSLFYYESQEKLMLSNHRATLSKYAYIQAKRLKVLHHFFDEKVQYPRDVHFVSAIYDIEYMKIFSLLKEEDIHFEKEIYRTGKYIHYIKSLDEFYLGSKYLILEIKEDEAWQSNIWKEIIGYGLLVFIFFIFFGLYLARLFVKPMRDSIVLLDRFIKDATHELNTPLSTILANIEMMDRSVMLDKNIVKLNRITIAAKMVSHLYSDLTYLTLEKEKENTDEDIHLTELIEERVEYFSSLATSKQLTFELELHKAGIVIDRRKLTRVIDNLLSNAIKYNKRKGIVGIKLSQGNLEIWDTGVGIEKEKIPFVFDRYMRFNQSEGGFGVGLNIVKTILDEYRIGIKVKSENLKGTSMVLTW